MRSPAVFGYVPAILPSTWIYLDCASPVSRLHLGVSRLDLDYISAIYALAWRRQPARALGKRTASVLTTHHVPQTWAQARRDYKSFHVRAAALIVLINKYVRPHDPIAIVPYADSACA